MRRGKKEGGFILLISLLTVLLFVVLVFEMDFQARADLLAAGNFRDDLAAFSLAESGLAAGKALLKEDLKEDDARAAGERSDHLSELWAFPIPESAVGEGTLSGQITDEAGKFNLNSLVLAASDKPDPTKKAQLERLFKLLEIDPTLVAPIIDWIDKNNDPEGYGAEEETYSRLDPPYSAKNAPLDTLEELLLIHGISLLVYQKIAPYLTLYTDDGKINVNTASSLVLQSLHEEIDEPIAEHLLAKRPYVAVHRFKDALGAAIGNQVSDGVLAVRSHVFSLSAYGNVRNTKKTMHAVWHRQTKRLLYFRAE